jgi:hypothetical protein
MYVISLAPTSDENEPDVWGHETKMMLIDRAGQTFEGGMAEHPDSEAHGGYAFCALACLCIMGEPHVIMPKYVYFMADIDIDLFL